MPNIEIYGRPDKPRSIQIRIIEKMKEIGMAEDVVVTEIDSHVYSCKNFMSVPFIRVCSTDSKEIKKIVSALAEAKIGLDVETLLLNNFISADLMG